MNNPHLLETAQEKNLYSTILNSDAFKRVIEKGYRSQFDMLFDISIISKRFVYRMMPEKYKSQAYNIYDKL